MKAFAASRAAEGEGAGVRLQMTPESIAASKRLGTKSARQRLAERRRRQRRRRMPRWRRSLLTKRRANRRRRRLVNGFRERVDVFKISPAKSFISDKMNELEMTAKVLTVILVW